MRLAIIDIGTNTCNLLITVQRNREIKTLYTGKEPVKLGKGGINSGVLTEEAMQRGLRALTLHKEKIDFYQVDELRAFGTSALRGAQNGSDFVARVLNETGLQVEIIDGNREAELIYKGVCSSVDLPSKPFLILDIGGGSNEFIIATDHEILWKKSFNIGMARVLERFQLSDPLTLSEIEEMEQWYQTELTDLWEQCSNYSIDLLIGCSGAFDTFLDLIQEVDPNERGGDATEIDFTQFKTNHYRLVDSTAEQRFLMKGMSPMRVEMIVLASVFVNFILDKLQLTRLLQSNGSLKEGAMAEVFAMEEALSQ